MADLPRAISEFVVQARNLCRRMQSSERTMVTAVDLHVLRTQLYLLEQEVINLQKEISLKGHFGIPPFT